MKLDGGYVFAPFGLLVDKGYSQDYSKVRWIWTTFYGKVAHHPRTKLKFWW